MRRATLYFLIFLLPIFLQAQDITVKAEYPSVVEAGQQFSIQWTVNSGGGEFEAVNMKREQSSQTYAMTLRKLKRGREA